MSLYCYRYDGTFSGFLTCVFESYVNKEEPAVFSLLTDGPTLLEEREVAASEPQAKRVYAALAKKVSPEFQKLIARGFLTCLPERELALYTLIRRGFAEGDRVRRDLTDPTMARLSLALAKMWTEWDHLKGFVRFSDLEGILVGEIQPKNRVLPLLAPHFADRFPGERLVLYDRTYHEAFFCENRRWTIQPVEEFHIGPGDAREVSWRNFWRKYFQTLSIEGRYNPKCQSTHLPKRYRHVMTEFSPAEVLPAKNLPGST